MGNEILIQTLYYAAVMILTMLGAGMFLRGFLLTYLRVRTSFGKYVLIKKRSPLRDHFTLGWVEENFLKYKLKGKEILIPLSNTKKPFYKCLNVMWIDIDEEKGAICEADYTSVQGFDQEKFSDFIKRALMRPTIGDTKEKIIILLLIVLIVGVIGCLYLGFTSYDQISVFIKNFPVMLESMRGTVISGPGTI